MMDVTQVKERLRNDHMVVADGWVVARAQYELWQEAEERERALLGKQAATMRVLKRLYAAASLWEGEPELESALIAARATIEEESSS